MVAIMPEGSQSYIMNSAPLATRAPWRFAFRETGVGEVGGLHPEDLAPVARGGELGHSPLERSPVLAQPADRAGNDGPAQHPGPVDRKLQGEGAAPRDAEHAGRATRPRASPPLRCALRFRLLSLLTARYRRFHHRG